MKIYYKGGPVVWFFFSTAQCLSAVSELLTQMFSDHDAGWSLPQTDCGEKARAPPANHATNTKLLQNSHYMESDVDVTHYF